jgi:hypothetical protein
MAEHIPSEESLFFETLQKSSPKARAAYVDRACAENPELHQRVLELLKSHEESQGPLDIPVAAIAPTIVSTSASIVLGAQIGPYKLLQPIGEGGMTAAIAGGEGQTAKPASASPTISTPTGSFPVRVMGDRQLHDKRRAKPSVAFLRTVGSCRIGQVDVVDVLIACT